MNVLKSSWQRSLAATTLVALISTVATDAQADVTTDGLAPMPVVSADLTDDATVPVLFQDREEGERPREGEARKGEGDQPRDGDREGDAREGDGDRDHPEARQGDHRPNPEVEMLRREFPDLMHRAEQIRNELREMGEAGQQTDKAHMLKRELAEIIEKMTHLRRERAEEEGDRPRPEQPRPEGPPNMEQLERMRIELRQKAERIEHQLRELGERATEGQRQEAHQALAQIGQQLQRIENAMRERHEGDRPRPDGPPRPDRPNMEQLEMLRNRLRAEAERIEHHIRELGERATEGQRQEARGAMERIGRQLHEIEMAMQQRREGEGDRPRPEPPRPDGPRGEEMERRLHHLRVAIENLHAAGLHEQAEQLERQVRERLERPDGPPRPEPPHRPEPPRPDNPEAAQLRGQVQQLRHQMEEMQQMMRMLIERQKQASEER